ncbi:UNVERIFIED_CONTAM: hypothetical protein NCL1_14531 [Trichonephila clavipes]
MSIYLVKIKQKEGKLNTASSNLTEKRTIQTPDEYLSHRERKFVPTAQCNSIITLSTQQSGKHRENVFHSITTQITMLHERNDSQHRISIHRI